MILRRLALTVFVSASCLLTQLRAAKPAPAAQSYRGAIVLDASSGNVLFQDNPDIVNPPASVTKLMTFLIVHDRIAAGALKLSTPVNVTLEDSRIGGTQVWLEPGEVFSVEDLLFALMIQSANDAANALARTAAGSREAFVAMMNERAQAIGMKQTTFRSPHGLPPSSRKIAEGDLTTPHDLALLSRELLLNTDILRYTSVTERKFRPGQPAPREVIMRSHNHLLGRVAGVDGLKTGFTNGAGYCLAATALRDGRRIIAVVMGSPTTKARDIKVAELIETGFAKLPLTAKFQGPSAPTATAGSPIMPVTTEDEADAPTAVKPVNPPAKPGDDAPTVKFNPPK